MCLLKPCPDKGNVCSRHCYLNVADLLQDKIEFSEMKTRAVLPVRFQLIMVVVYTPRSFGDPWVNATQRTSQGDKILTGKLYQGGSCKDLRAEMGI